MPTEPQDHCRFILDVAAAVAGGWERQRERIEHFAAPMRTWLIHQLGPQPGDTLLEARRRCR